MIFIIQLLWLKFSTHFLTASMCATFPSVHTLIIFYVPHYVWTRSDPNNFILGQFTLFCYADEQSFMPTFRSIWNLRPFDRYLGSTTFRPDMYSPHYLVGTDGISIITIIIFFMTLTLLFTEAPGTVLLWKQNSEGTSHVIAAGSLVTSLSGALEQEVSAIACASNLGVTYHGKSHSNNVFIN